MSDKNQDITEPEVEAEGVISEEESEEEGSSESEEDPIGIEFSFHCGIKEKHIILFTELLLPVVLAAVLYIIIS